MRFCIFANKKRTVELSCPPIVLSALGVGRFNYDTSLNLSGWDGSLGFLYLALLISSRKMLSSLVTIAADSVTSRRPGSVPILAFFFCHILFSGFDDG